MTAAGKDFTPFRTGRGLAASRRPSGDARFPVRNGAAGVGIPPCRQATQLNNEVSTLIGDLTVVAGAGTLSFVWKVDCEEDYISHEATWDHVAFLTNGVEVARMDGDSGWKTFSITFTDAGLHTNRWIFVKDDFNEEDFRDRAWLSEVRWIPYVATEDVVVDIGGGKTVTVPAAWLAEKTTRAATDVAANGRKVWECYVLGLDPENKFDCFHITSLPMKMDGTPDLDRITFEPPQSQWNVPGATVKVKGKVNLTDTQWQDVPADGNSAFRFFRVEVVLP